MSKTFNIKRVSFAITGSRKLNGFMSIANLAPINQEVSH